jgi:hypothetical protein
MKMMMQTGVLAMLNCPDLDERQANIEAFVLLIALRRRGDPRPRKIRRARRRAAATKGNRGSRVTETPPSIQ